MRTKKEVGTALNYYLIDTGKTVEEIAAELNVSKQSVYAWMKGTPMRNRYYLQLLKMLDGYDESKWIISNTEEQLNDYFNAW